jgi:hypothetical protein
MSISEEQSCGRPHIAGKPPKKRQPPTPKPLTTLYQRSADDTSERLTIYVRFTDLVDARIVRNWATLQRLIREEGFPTGIMIGAHTRAWPLREVESWRARRPVANNDVRLRGKRQKEEATA